MKKHYVVISFIFLLIIILVIIIGKLIISSPDSDIEDTEEVSTEISSIDETTETTTEITTEEFSVASDSDSELASPTTAKYINNYDGKELPSVIEPSNDGRKFDPKIVNADLFKSGEYDYDLICSAVLNYCYLIGRENNCSEIKVLEADTRGTIDYKLELKFKDNDSIIVEMIPYAKNYVITTFVEDDDVGSAEE